MTQDFLKEAKMHELLGGIFGWIWILGSLVGIGWLIAAVFTDASWWVGIAIFLGAQFCKAVLREYKRAAQKALANGIAAGQIEVDANNQARPVP